MSLAVRSFKYVAIVLFLLTGFTSISHAQLCWCGGSNRPANVTPSGTEFLLVFDQNEDKNYIQDQDYQDVYLATLDDSATITITSKAHPTLQKVYNLPPHQSAAYRLNSLPGSKSDDFLVYSNELLSDNVILVNATAPIVCYGMNHRNSTADAFIALPRNIAGTEYRVLSYTNSKGINAPDHPSEFSVAAFSNNTSVEITVKAKTSTGKAAGSVLKFVLDSGTCVQIQADQNDYTGDLTGSHIRSDKPIVVYGAHVRTEVPHDFLVGGSTSRDHLCEAMPPTSTWGNTFVTTGFQRPKVNDLIRVLALNAGTTVTINGNPWKTLNQDEFADTMISSKMLIQTSGPALVGEIAHTAADKENNGFGDPFLALVPPVEQGYNDLTVYASPDTAYQNNNFLQVVTESSGVSKITLDGSLLPAIAFSAIGQQVNGLTYSLATINVTPGAHRLTSTNDPAHGFTVMTYGFGSVDSYGYTSGSLFRPIRGISLSGSGNEKNRLFSEPNVADIQNITTMRIYFDSAFVLVNGKRNDHFHVKENVAFDIGTIDMAGSARIHVVLDETVDEPTDVQVVVYYHSGSWSVMEPQTVNLYVVPQTYAGVKDQTAKKSLLSANFPNPFSATTSLSYLLPERADVSLTVYDALGRIVTRLVDEEQVAGVHSVSFNASGLPNGSYSYELTSSKLGIHERKSMILNR